MSDTETPSVGGPSYRSLHHEGTGPGAFTPDGCPVDLYARLSANGEPEIVEEAAPAGSSLLELGAGAGRLTRPLLAKGFRVTAVDESAEMLARVEDAPTVRSTIEGLHLGTRFDVVLLASFLVNTADHVLRAALLDTCSRHVAPNGCVLIQREGAFQAEARRGDEWRRPDGMRVRVARREGVGGGAKRTRMEYAFEDTTWSHTFVSHDLPDPALEQALRDAGLARDAYLTEDRTWVRAVPV